MIRPLAAATLCVCLSSSSLATVTMDWVLIPDEFGNFRDTTGFGDVDYGYQISKHEVTVAQYAEFLNAVEKTFVNRSFDGSLYNGSNSRIIRSGSNGSFVYTPQSGWQNTPISLLSIFDAMRFTNWLNNGQGNGDTETGAYDFTTGGSTSFNIREPGGTIFIPTENEWYKAAYFDSSVPRYWQYPTGSNTPPTGSGPSSGFNRVATSQSRLWPVGSFPNVPSPYGTFDQGGNAREWTQQDGFGRTHLRGGSRATNQFGTRSTNRLFTSSTSQFNDVGFRVVTTVPEPGSLLYLSLLFVGLGVRRTLKRSS